MAGPVLQGAGTGIPSSNAITLRRATTARICSPRAGIMSCPWATARSSRFRIKSRTSSSAAGNSAAPSWPTPVRRLRSGSGSSLQATGNSQTADQIAPVVKLGGKGPNDPYYDPMSFRDPLFAFTASGNTVDRFGSTGRNILYGPGYWQLSPAIFKDFKIKEKVTAEFRAESTNFTNTPIWGSPKDRKSVV